MPAHITLHPDYQREISEFFQELQCLSDVDRQRWLLFLRVLVAARRDNIPPASQYALYALEARGCPWRVIRRKRRRGGDEEAS